MENLIKKNIFIVISIAVHTIPIAISSFFQPSKNLHAVNLISRPNIKFSRSSTIHDNVSLKKSSLFKANTKSKTPTTKDTSGLNANANSISNNAEEIATNVKAQIVVNYPMRARKEGIEGDVIVICTISKDGKVKNIDVDYNRSTNQEILINEIKRAIMAAQFSNLIVETKVELPFSFKLTN